MDSILMIGVGFCIGMGIYYIPKSFLGGFAFFTIALGIFVLALFYQDYSNKHDVIELGDEQ